MGLSPELREWMHKSVGEYKSREKATTMQEHLERSAGLVMVAAGNRQIDDDQFQGCMAQLCYASTKYKPEKGVKWSTYAVNVAKRYLIEQWQKKQREKHNEEKVIKRPYSANGFHILDGVVDKKAVDPLDSSTLRDSIRQMMRNMDCLSYREREVIQLRFGINGVNPWTLNEIAAHQKCSKERIRQIETQALNKLREKLTHSLNWGR